MHMCNMNALSHLVLKVITKVKFTLNRQTDRQPDREDDSCIPQTSFAGDIEKPSDKLYPVMQTSAKPQQNPLDLRQRVCKIRK